MISQHDLLIIVIVSILLSGGGLYYGYGRTNVPAQVNGLIGVIISVLIVIFLLRLLGI